MYILFNRFIVSKQILYLGNIVSQTCDFTNKIKIILMNQSRVQISTLSFYITIDADYKPSYYQDHDPINA